MLQLALILQYLFIPCTMVLSLHTVSFSCFHPIYSINITIITNNETDTIGKERA